MEIDIYRVNEIADLQQRILESLGADPADILIKIAALRSAADLLSQAVASAALTAAVASALAPRR